MVHTNGDAAFPAMLDAIGRARSRVSFETYVYESGEIADRFTAAFEDAARRGVEVRLVLDSIGAKKTDASHIDRLERAGCRVVWYNRLAGFSFEEIYEYQRAMMHTKALVVDGVLSIVGSANFGNRSLELNEELNVAAFDRALAARLTADMERDIRQSVKLDLEGWRARPLHIRGREQLWSFFGEVF